LQTCFGQADTDNYQNNTIMGIIHTVKDRFLRYVQIDTQSDPKSDTFPSTMKQKDLGNLLVKELLAIGIQDAAMDENGYVYATIPSNSDKKIPTICFCSHMDTAPDASGTNVKPIIHKNYDGGVLSLPDDPTVLIDPAKHKDLGKKIGHDVVTASGLTLLGADDKAGIAEIMDAATHLMGHPEIKHGTIKILFTPDEEIGRGVDKLDVERLNADFVYTMDGEEVGTVEDETFSADGGVITITGVSQHPGYAKGKMESAIKIAAEIVEALPKDRLSPETTSGKEGFIHPTRIAGLIESTTIEFILRDFDDAKLAEHGVFLRKLMEDVMKKYPGSKAELVITEQYRNMKNILKDYPEVTNYVVEAMKRLNLNTVKGSIRGGTDGSRLSFMGLPAPNIFAAGHAFHSKQEWVTVQDMEMAVKTIVELVKIWEEHAEA